MSDLATLGKRIRHFRTSKGFTLDALGAEVGIATSQLSLIENGHREPRISQLSAIAVALDVQTADLLEAGAPTHRAKLELDLQRLQDSPSFLRLGLPRVKPTKSLGDDTLESLVGLMHELDRRDRAAIATPEEARRASTQLRQRMRECANQLPDLDALAEEQLAAAGYERGSLTHRTVTLMAKRLGFDLVYVQDLPASTRSVTDVEHGRIYLPPASIPGGHGLRSMALQAIAHRLLGHTVPKDYAEFLQQRLEINYFAAATLMPRTLSLQFLQQAKRDKNIAVEDFRDAFGVTHETAAMRVTNLANELDLTVHFLRVAGDGTLQRAYENDGLPLPVDSEGSIEGQFVCRQFAARAAFDRTTHTTEFYQRTQTPEGDFWCSTQTGVGDTGEFSITFGVPQASSKWFRGGDTTATAVSRCPDGRCCHTPDEASIGRWRGHSWASARMHAHVLAPLPQGTYPGVDDVELYRFLDRHADGS